MTHVSNNFGGGIDPSAIHPNRFLWIDKASWERHYPLFFSIISGGAAGWIFGELGPSQPVDATAITSVSDILGHLFAAAAIFAGFESAAQAILMSLFDRPVWVRLQKHGRWEDTIRFQRATLGSSLILVGWCLAALVVCKIPSLYNDPVVLIAVVAVTGGVLGFVVGCVTRLFVVTSAMLLEVASPNH